MGTRELLTFVSAAIGLMALAIDAMLPAFGEMRVSFGLEPGSTSIGQTLTAFFAGIAVAQLIWGPLTDRYGRRPILYAGLIVYVLGAAASALAPSLGALTAARFLWGVGAGGPRVVVTAIVRDTHVGEDMARAMSSPTCVSRTIAVTTTRGPPAPTPHRKRAAVSAPRDGARAEAAAPST